MSNGNELSYRAARIESKLDTLSAGMLALGQKDCSNQSRFLALFRVVREADEDSLTHLADLMNTYVWHSVKSAMTGGLTDGHKYRVPIADYSGRCEAQQLLSLLKISLSDGQDEGDPISAGNLLEWLNTKQEEIQNG